MNTITYIERSLKYYRRTAIGIIAGCAVSAAVITGALVVGHSVRGSLKNMAWYRIGRISHAVIAGDRLFTDSLPKRLESVETKVACAMMLEGACTTDGGKKRVNGIQVVGVDDGFWQLAPEAGGKTPQDGEVALNSTLASRLGVKEGDLVSLRLSKPDAMPSDVPLVAESDTAAGFTAKVSAIVLGKEMGNFSFRASQTPSDNVFVSRAWLCKRLGIEGKANLLLISAGEDETVKTLTELLKKKMTLADYGLTLKELPQLKIIELKSDRIFIDAPIAASARKDVKNSEGVFSYFVNEFKHGDNVTPYSFVAAPGNPLVPQAMKDDEIVVNQWLADDLKLKVGDSLTVNYYVLGELRSLEEKTTSFKVAKIVPMSGAALDRDLMLDLPGLVDTESCRDWKSGIPIDTNKIRDRDESYWKKYKGTPKAFVTLAAAQKLWRNRFGDLTAVRYPGQDISEEGFGRRLAAGFSPDSIGLRVMPVRERALAAGKGSVDFGGLFIGLSFFIIVAGVLLTAMLFVFMIESREREIGTLLAIGFNLPRVRRLLLTEGMVLSLVGSCLGGAIGVGYAKVVLWALSSYWQGAIGHTFLNLYASPRILGGGVMISLITSSLAMVILLWRSTWSTVQQLQSGAPALVKRCFSWWRHGLIPVGCFAAVLAIVFTVPTDTGAEAAGVFFGAGSLALIGMLIGFRGLLVAAHRGSSLCCLSALALRNCARRSWRSTTVASLLASGIFLVVAVAANKQGELANPEVKSSGTGGYILYGQSSLPILNTPNSTAGRKALGIPSALPASFALCRLHEGDDASCLNINQVTQPAILSVPVGSFARDKRFTFTKTLPTVSSKLPAGSDPWSMLDHEFDDGAIPAVADQSVLDWGIKMKLGQDLIYHDGQGREVKLRLVGGLANSIMQGQVMISDENFLKLFPDSGGVRVLMVSCPESQAEKVADVLTQKMAKYGLSVERTETRLARFGEVQNTYLMIFLSLGGLGVILGTVGLAVVLLRNVLERRSELALLRAVGFKQRDVTRLIFQEHAILLCGGLLCGLIPALVSVIPGIASPSADLPWATMAGFVAAIMINGFIWIFVGTWLAAKQELLPALRNE